MPSVSRKPDAKCCLTLRPTALLAACFLAAAALVLAYLGGVMSGRAYWHSHPAPLAGRTEGGEARDGVPPEEASARQNTEPEQKILAPEELRFSRVLRNDASTGDAPLKPLPSLKPAQPHPAAAANAPAALPAPPAAAPAHQAAPAPSAPPPAAQSEPEAAPAAPPGALFDYVFQVGAFKDEDTVDSLRQRLEGRGLRTRMQRSGKLYVVLVLLRGDEARAAEVQRAAESLGLGKPVRLSRKPVLQP